MLPRVFSVGCVYEKILYDNFCNFNFRDQTKMNESEVRVALSQCIKTIVKEHTIKEAMRVSGLGYKAVWSILEDEVNLVFFPRLLKSLGLS